MLKQLLEVIADIGDDTLIKIARELTGIAKIEQLKYVVPKKSIK